MVRKCTDEAYNKALSSASFKVKHMTKQIYLVTYDSLISNDETAFRKSYNQIK